MKKNQIQLENIDVFHDNDVLSGRGKAINNHKGNNYFYKLVLQYRDAFASGDKTGKSKIASQIVDIIRNQEPPGRFLKQNSNGLWSDIGNKKALEKIRQAIRDAIAVEQAQEKSFSQDQFLPYMPAHYIIPDERFSTKRYHETQSEISNEKNISSRLNFEKMITDTKQISVLEKQTSSISTSENSLAPSSSYIKNTSSPLSPFLPSKEVEYHKNCYEVKLAKKGSIDEDHFKPNQKKTEIGSKVICFSGRESFHNLGAAVQKEEKIKINQGEVDIEESSFIDLDEDDDLTLKSIEGVFEMTEEDLDKLNITELFDEY